LSPEQITGEPLDGRCDLFALGIVLWELLAGQKLFAGDNDLAVLKLIESCNQHVKPPSKFNSAVTKELDYIVLKMLAKDREKRYQSGEEIQRALHKFLYAFNPDFNPGDLAYVAKDMFKNEIVEDRKKLKRLNDKAEQLLTTEAVDSVCSSPGMKVFSSAEDSTMVVETQEKEQIRMKPTRQSEGVSKANSNKIKAANKIELEDSNPSSVGAVLPKATGPVYASSAPTNSKLAPRQRPSSIGRPKQSGGGFFRAVLFVAVGISALVFFGPELGLNLDFGLKLPKLDFLAAGKSPVAEPTRAVRVEQDAGVSEKGVLLKLNIIPGGNNMSVAVNGRSLDPKNSSLRVPLDTLMELSVERVGFKGIRREFTLGAEQVGNSKEWTMDIALEPLQFGYVTLRSTPSAEATIVFEGYPWVRKIPIENEKFAVGTYQVKLRNELLGMEKDISFVVQNGKTLVLDERLSIKN
jgi:hypothetical protein